MVAKVLFQVNGHILLAAYSGWLAVPLLMIGVFNVIPGWKLPAWIASCSFPLYAVHYFVLCAIPSAAVEGIRARGFVLWLPMTLGVIAITFGIVVIQRRWFSSLNRYLYGGR